MDRREGNIKDRIIKATLEIAREEGIENVTIRKIAHAADANVASINYHFGCKDNILNEAVNDLLKSMVVIFSILDRADMSCEERIRKFLIQYFENAISYPFFSKGILDQIVSNPEQSEVCNECKKSYSKLKEAISEYTGIMEDNILSAKAIQIISNIIYPALIVEKSEYLFGLDYRKKEVREKYVLLLMESLR